MKKAEFEKNIPQQLKQHNNWVCWRLEERNGKPTKIPINPKTGGNAMSNNADTWGSFSEAMDSVQKNHYKGIGYMFSVKTGIVGVDIDKCRKTDSGELSTEAKDILSTLNSYTEISPSGTGVHVLCSGKLPSSGRRSGNVEMYEEGRFFTITGKVLADYSPKIEERTEALALIHKKYIQKPEKPQVTREMPILGLNEREVIEKAMAASNGSKFQRLFNGVWQGDYKSQSEADMALCSHLAFWCQCDPRKMDGIFRQSGLYRGKWDEIHGSGTYGQKTIDEAIRNCRETYIPKGEYQSKQKQQPEHDLELISLDTVKAEPVNWLWYPYLPKGKLTLLQGNPGEGKTFFSLNIAAIISKGEPMPGETEWRKPGTVLYQSAEDSLSDTVKPRLVAAGADCSKIFCIDEAGASLSFRDERIEKMLQKLKPALVVFDPIQAFLGADTDMHRANEVRPILTRLLKLAEQYDCAVLLLMHLSKSQASNKLYRGLGSIDIAAAARSVLLCGCDPNNNNIRGVAHIKSSLAPAGDTIGFSLDKENGFQWKGKSDLTADMMLNPVKEDGTESKLQRAKEFLLEKLSGGDRIDAAELKKEARSLDIKSSTLWDAKDALNVQAKKKDFKGGWFWFLNLEDLDEKQFLLRTEKHSDSSRKETPSNIVKTSTPPKNQTDNSSSNSSVCEEPEQFFGKPLENTVSDRRITNMFLIETQSDVLDGEWESDEQCPF